MNAAYRQVNQDGTLLLTDQFDSDLAITEDGEVRCRKVVISGVDTLTSSGITGTILTPAQPNITSIGALLSFDATTINATAVNATNLGGTLTTGPTVSGGWFVSAKLPIIPTPILEKAS